MTATAGSVDRRGALLRIRPFTADLVGAVRDFNRRLAAGGVQYRFPEGPASAWLPNIGGRHIYQEYFLAVEDGTTVRGGYILKRQDFVIHGNRQSIGFYHLPLSEGLLDRRHGLVALRLLTDALKRAPATFVLGIGGMQEPLSRMLTAMSWRLRPVPFCFKVLRPARVARGLTYLRTTPLRRLALDIAAVTGGAWLVARAGGMRTMRLGRAAVSVEPRFGEWADRVWAVSRTRYAMLGVRDSETLNILYPADDRRFIRVMVSAQGACIGWAVVLATDMQDHKYFGDIRVGSLVDCLAAPEHAGAVIAGAVQCLKDRGVDLVVSNQTADVWVRGLRRAGFLPGPSTFLFGASKALAALMRSDEALRRSHINRGDGDGPINL